MAITVSVGDIVRVTLRAVMAGSVQCLNVFHYAVTAVDPAVNGNTLRSAAISVWYNLQDNLRPYIGGNVVFQSIIAESLDLTTWNVINGEEFAIPSGEQVGQATGDVLPPANCWSFKYTRATSDFRHGYKRFPGVPENKQHEGLVNSGDLAGMNVIADALFADVIFADEDNVDAGTGRLIPRIYKAQRYGSTVRPVEFQKPAAVVYEGIGTQNTRKFGRGS